MARRFDQYCPVAHALCLVGERWSLLVVRELLHGPKRYTDLVEGLPGIGTNILATRLRDLEEAGVVRKRKLPPPAPDDELYPEWGVNALPALFDPEAARGLSETYVLRIGEDVFSARLENGHLRAEQGATENADLDAAMDMETFFALASGELDPRTALAEGRVELAAGKAARLERCFKVFSIATRIPVAV